MTSEKTKTNTEATVNLITQAIEMPGETFDILKGVLCADMALDSTAKAVYATLFDCQLIAKALDAINRGEDISNPWDLWSRKDAA